MRAICRCAAAIGLITVSVTGLAQESQRQVDEEVIVRGQRMSEIEFDIDHYIQDFIGQVVTRPAGTGYARWYRSVCVGVYNLDPTPAQYIADRISLLAMEVGIEPEEPGCTPDVIIVFSLDADDIASTLVEDQPRLFRPGGPVCCMQLGLDALDRFTASDRPVRWWHVSLPVDVRQKQRAISMPQEGNDAYPIINVAGPSRIHNGIEDQLYRVVIVVDATQITGTTWQEIGDYLAVLSLAQVNPETDPSEYDSILNLFTNPAAYSGLTDWDRSYVRALYEIDMERHAGFQENQIVDRMARREAAEVEAARQ